MSLFYAAVERYHLNPQTSIDRFFLPDEVEFLAKIGHQPAEMHAYVQEYATLGDPSPTTILLIASVRRAFFLTAQRGISGNAAPVSAESLPAETEDLQEIAYLPRIIRKAEAKLFGTLDSRIMYGCAKDRQFLREHGNIHPADFLYLTWNARGDKQKLVSAVLNAMKQQSAEHPQPGEEAVHHPSAVEAMQCELPLN